LFATVVGCALCAPSFTRAQQQFDPAQFRERMMNNIKERLGASDDEWKVISPKVEKVMTAQRDARGGGGFAGFGGRGRRGGGGDQQPTTETGKASADLQAALENKDTPADDIAKKLAAYREARDKGRAALQASQKELKEILTQRQEAVLVNMGMLE
jgi:multidrug efflux pump subunit AcrB